MKKTLTKKDLANTINNKLGYSKEEAKSFTQVFFNSIITNIVKEKKISHMDAVLWYCEKEGLELEGISPLISKALKEKIEADARELNFLPRQAKLPI